MWVSLFESWISEKKNQDISMNRISFKFQELLEYFHRFIQNFFLKWTLYKQIKTISNVKIEGNERKKNVTTFKNVRRSCIFQIDQIPKFLNLVSVWETIFGLSVFCNDVNPDGFRSRFVHHFVVARGKFFLLTVRWYGCLSICGLHCLQSSAYLIFL